MPIYDFQSITSAQAAAFTTADTLIFGNTAQNAGLISFSTNPSDGTIRLDSRLGGTVIISQAFASTTAIFADGSVFRLPAAAAQSLLGSDVTDNIFGGGGADTLTGKDGLDYLDGGDGDDVLVGGAGPDQLTGGAGSDTFVIPPTEASVGAGAQDVITDWQVGDRLQFAAAATSGNYIELSASTDFNALTLANAQIASGAADYVVVSVGSDLIVYVDSRNDNGAVDDSVRLTGRTVADISVSNIIGGAPTTDPSADTLSGTSGADSFSGGAGADLISGAAGADTLSGDAGADTLNGGDDNDIIIGGAGADRLSGGAGGDTFVLNAGDGNTLAGALDLILDWQSTDLLYFPTGALADAGRYMESTASGYNDALSTASALIGSNFFDYVVTAIGSDLVVFADAGGNVTSATALVGRTLSDISLANFTAPNPATNADTLTGTAGPDTLDGGGGNDLVSGDLGADSLVGGLGADTLRGGDANDTLVGGGGNDSIDGGAGVDLVTFKDAASGATVYLALGSAQPVSAGEGTDVFTQVENLEGSGYGDYLRGDGESNVISGLAGADLIGGEGGADTLSGGEGDDQLGGDGGNDSVAGDGGDDNLTGGAGDDTLVGGAGNDGLHEEQGGADSLSGGEGDDNISLAPLTNGSALWNVTVDGGVGDDEIRLDGSKDRLDVVASGGIGADNFVLMGRVGGQIDAGDGADRIQIFGATVQASVTLGAGADTITYFLAPGSEAYGLPHGATVFQDFNPTQDQVTGDLSGALVNWNGQNPFSAGYLALAAVGSDTILRFSAGGGAQTLDLARFVGLTPAQLGATSFFGFKADGSAAAGETISGTVGNDPTLHGGLGADSIAGLGGADTITGQAGADTLDGGTGDDILYGQEGDDLVHGGDGNDVMDGGDRDHIFGDAGSDTIQAVVNAAHTGAPTLEGGGGDDRLLLSFTAPYVIGIALGGDGSDTLTAEGVGDATLDGGVGDDLIVLSNIRSATVTLGAGHDTVRFDPTENTPSFATITDFQTGPGGDNLDLPAYLDAVLYGWDQDTNPFGLNLLRLVASGSDTILQGWLRGGGWVDMVKLQNVAPSALTPDNLSGYPSDGSIAPGRLLEGAGGSDTLGGAVGPDTLIGAGGADSLSGGRGADQVSGGDGADTIDGGNGPDAMVGGTGADSITGGLGDDSMAGEDGNDTLFGGDAGADLLMGGAGIDKLSGWNGNDILVGGAGADELYGGAGADAFLVAAGESPATGGAFDTILDWEAADSLNFQTRAGTAANYVEGVANGYDAARAYANTAIAGGVVDFVAVGVTGGVYVFADSAGNDGVAEDVVFLTGRSLSDIDFTNIVNAVPPTAPTSPPPGPGGGLVTGTSAADVLVGGMGSDSIAGLGGDDQLFGYAGADTLDGGAGNDLIQGGTGGDFLDGGTGVDMLSYINAQDTVSASLAAATGQLVGSDGVDAVSNFENLEGSAYNDSLTGDAQGNLIRGWTGDDSLSGGGGADTLEGREGADSIRGGDGGDWIEGGSGADVIAMGAGADTVWVGSGNSGLAFNSLDRIIDWSSEDRLLFGYATGTYAEAVAADYGSALVQANALIVGGVRYAAVAVGADVIVFADTDGNGGSAEDAVVLTSRTLGDVSEANLGSLTQAAIAPAPPAGGGGGGGGGGGSPAGGGGGGGGGGGTSGGEFGVGGFRSAFQDGTPAGDVMALGPGEASFNGGMGDDSLDGEAGNDLLYGGPGNDMIHGGLDNDSIEGGDGANYLRGDEGSDQIVGGSGFDDINGNQGDDSAAGGLGDDWVVGGKDQDLLFGNDGADIVYGNLGNDTLGGGTGEDLMRGGQGSDIIRGDEGKDWLSGDRGDDTLTGGLGADIFHTFSEANIDRVTDFSVSDGDRVQLDPGTVYTLVQEGFDTVIDMGAGNRMILVNVQLSGLPAGWIFGA